jgi:phage tail sheath gpL-like
MLAAGTATAGELYEIGADSAEDGLFDANSHIAGMCREFRKVNEVTDLTALPLDDAAGTNATAVAAVTGAATVDGTLYLSVGSVNEFRAKIDITSGDTATEIGDAIVTAFTLFTNAPFTFVNSTGTVTFTSTHDGTISNDWPIKVEGVVPGVAVTLTGWASGATDPSLTGILDVLGNRRFTTIVWPSAYDLAVVETLLNARFNASNRILDGIVVQTKADTLANLKTYADQNSPSVVLVGTQAIALDTRKGNQFMEMPDIISARIAAVRSLRLTTDAILTPILTTSAPADQFGGKHTGSLPYFNTLLPSTLPPEAADEFIDVELDELKDAGVSVIGANRAFSASILGTFVTTYLTDIAGNPEESFKYLNIVDTSSLIREYYYENCRRRYAQTRLTGGDLIQGRDMANQGSIKAFLSQLYDELTVDTLTQAGATPKKQFTDNLVVTVDLVNQKAIVAMAPPLVVQLRQVQATFEINFGG